MRPRPPAVLRLAVLSAVTALGLGLTVVRTGVLTGTPRRSMPEGRLIPPPATDDARLRGRLAGPGGYEETVIKLGPRVRVG